MCSITNAVFFSLIVHIRTDRQTDRRYWVITLLFRHYNPSFPEITNSSNTDSQKLFISMQTDKQTNCSEQSVYPLYRHIQFVFFPVESPMLIQSSWFPQIVNHCADRQTDRMFWLDHYTLYNTKNKFFCCGNLSRSKLSVFMCTLFTSL